MNKKWHPLLRLAGTILAFILLAWIAILVRTAVLDQQRILFQVISFSGWPGGKSGGIFITETGDIYQFEINQRFSWLYDWIFPKYHEPPYKTSDLYRWYGLFPRHKGKINPETLKNMVQKIEHLKDDELVSMDSGCRDGGGIIFNAYIYDENDRTYTPIMLYSAGDYTASKITSDESQQLHEWLWKVLLENVRIYGGVSEGCQP